MATQFLFRPLNFDWKPDLFKNKSSESSALSLENYVNDLMMKLPAFPRSNAPTLIIETGYTTFLTNPQQQQNLTDEAFLGKIESRSLIVNKTPNYTRGGVLMNPAMFASTGTSAGAGSSRSTTPVKVGLNADISLQNRIAIPHSPPQNNNSINNNNDFSSSSNENDEINNNFSDSSSSTYYRRNGTALLVALEHRRRMRGDETFFGMIAFSNLARPPIDLVAPFRMGATNPNEHIFGQVAPENYRLTLAAIKNDEDLLRLYEEISSSSSFRDAASRLSIVCFITASAPPDARHNAWSHCCACSLQQLVSNNGGGSGGTDVVVLLQEEHHRDAMVCLGVDTAVKLRRPESSQVPAAVVREFEQWGYEREKLNRQSQQQRVYDNLHHNQQQRSASATQGLLSTSTKLPCAAEVLKCISSQVGLRGDCVVLSRLSTESLSTDQLSLWKLVSDVDAAKRNSSENDKTPKLFLEGHNNNNNNTPASSSTQQQKILITSPSGTQQDLVDGDDENSNNNKNTKNRFFGSVVGSNPTDWIIPIQTTSRNELLEQLRKEQEEIRAQQQLEEENRKRQALSRGTSVTAFVQASAGALNPSHKSAMISEVEALEEQVNLQKQALRWFQQHIPKQQHQQQQNNNNQPATASPASQLQLPKMNSSRQQQQQQQQQTNPFLPAQTLFASSVSRNASPEPRTNTSVVHHRQPEQQHHQQQDEFNEAAYFGENFSPPAASNNNNNSRRNLNNNNTNQQHQHQHQFSGSGSGVVASPLQSSPQAVRTKLTRAHHQTDEMSDNKSKWVLELDRVEVAHSAAVAKRFHAARRHAELLVRTEELQREITEIQSHVLLDRQHVEEKSRNVLALRKQLDVSDGATKRAEAQLAELERQHAQKHKQEHDALEQLANQRKREIDGWYERATQFQREAEVQRATTIARFTGALADEKRRKENMAMDRARLLQEMAQAEASFRLTEVSITELRRKVATTQTELQRARSLHHELSITHQDINLETAVLSRLRIDCQHLQDQVLELEKGTEAAEEKNRMNNHTSEEVTRFADISAAQSFYCQINHLRADEHSSRRLIYRDFMQLHSNFVRNFFRHAMVIEEQNIDEQLRTCRSCQEMTKSIQLMKVETAANGTKRRQVAQESVAKERQLEMVLQKAEKEIDTAAQQRQELVAKLEVHQTRHASEREKTSQRLSSLNTTRDALLNEFFRQIDGETRRAVSQLVAVNAKEKQQQQQQDKNDNNNDQDSGDAPAVTVNLVNESAPAFTAAEYVRWCDEISDAAAAEQRVHDLQERLNAADSAAVISSDQVAESRSLLLHLEHENETRETALRALEKEVDSRRHWLKNRRAELEEKLEAEYQDADQRNKSIESQLRASTDAIARLKKTVSDERFRANALVGEIETVETGSAVALLMQELKSIRESNKTRREILQAANRAASNQARSKSDLERSGKNFQHQHAVVRNPADLSVGTRYPPAAPSDQFSYGDLPGNDVRFFAANDARSPDVARVPTHLDFTSAVRQAKNLVNERSTLYAPGFNSPNLNNNNNNNNARSPSL